MQHLFTRFARSISVFWLGALLCCASAEVKLDVKVTDFGKTADGTPVEEYTLTNQDGAIVKLISRGATLTFSASSRA